MGTARRTLENARLTAKNWEEYRVVLLKPYLKPQYQNITLTFWGSPEEAPAPAPKSISSSSSKSDGLFCDIEAKRQKIEPANPLPPRNVLCPLDNYGNRANTWTLSPDDYQPDVYINEFYPCKEGASNTKEFIELKRFPHKTNKAQVIRHHKVVAFTAKTRDNLLLVINLHQSTVI